MDRIKEIVSDWKSGKRGAVYSMHKISSYLDENTEGVSTSSRTESGVSHGVSDRNASRSDSTEDSEGVVGGTLALRTEAKEVCPNCGESDIFPTGPDRLCFKCHHVWMAN